MTSKILISVFGGSRCTSQEAEWATQVGREIARRGGILVCGGLSGIMEAACRGARQQGGTVVGILPGTEAAAANPCVDIPIVTGLGFARNTLVAYTGQAAIAIGGKLGTLTEICYGLLHGKKVVTLGSWNLDPRRLAPYEVERAANPQEAVEKAWEAARNFQARG